MPHPIKLLADVFRALFPRNAQLYEFLRNYDYEKAQDLVDSLPDSAATPPVEFKSLAARQVQAHGIDDARLFGQLGNDFPQQRAMIDATRREYLGDVAHETDRTEGSEPAMADVSDTEAARLVRKAEKVMGERPSFPGRRFSRRWASTRSIGRETAHEAAKQLVQWHSIFDQPNDSPDCAPQSLGRR